MSEMEFPELSEPVDSTSPAALKEALEAGEDVTILDTRAEADYESWAIDGETVTDANVPYYEFLDGVDDGVLDRVPDDEDLVVVCAKGKSSEFVAGKLNEAGYDATNLADGMRGWARVYEHSDIDLGAATVRQYRRPSSGCLAYMVYGDGEAAVVDPLRAFVDRYVADAADLGVEITAVLETHVHADHVSGARTLAAETGATLVLPAGAVARGIDYDRDYTTVSDGDTVAVGGLEIAALSTPGHTSGMTSYLVDGLAITGDTLFLDSVARPDLEGGDEGAPEAARQLYETLQDRVLALDDDTLVAPAHSGGRGGAPGEGARVAPLWEVREAVDLLSADEGTFVETVLGDMPPRPANYEEVIATNMGQRTASDAEAFELELGPNNCAASE